MDMSNIFSMQERIAAGYLLDIRDPDATPERISEAMEWINQAPENRLAFDRANRFFEVCDAMDADDIQEAITQQRGRWTQFNMNLLAAAVSVIILGVSFVLLLSHSWIGNVAPQSLAFNDGYKSNVGETRTIILPDGSSVLLGGGSKVQVRFSDDKRTIALAQGQALFKVAKDPHRPFFVESGSGQIMAKGTEFDVKRSLQNMTVTLIHGVVVVNSRKSPDGSSVILNPGMQVDLTDGGQMDRAKFVDVNRVMDWRHGLLKFEDASLASVVFDLNRYSKRMIVINDRDLEEKKITGSVKVDAIDDWLAGLSQAIDVSVDYSDEGRIGLDRTTSRAIRSGRRQSFTRRQTCVSPA
jgi:transmembrane sensor